MLPTAFASSFHYHTLSFSFILLHIHLSCSCFRRCYILTTTGTYHIPQLLLTNSVRQIKIKRRPKVSFCPHPKSKEEMICCDVNEKAFSVYSNLPFPVTNQFFFHVVLALHHGNGGESRSAEM